MKNLKDYKPTNLTVLKQPDESIVILLNFESLDESTSFMQEVIEKHKFKISVGINENRTYTLSIFFPDRNETFVFNTGRTDAQYSSLKFLVEKRKAVFSCGKRYEDGRLEIYNNSMILDEINLN